MTTTTPDLEHCDTCGSDDISVVVCTHVLAGTGPDVEITSYLSANPQEIPRHECDQKCDEHALCGDCWSDL